MSQATTARGATAAAPTDPQAPAAIPFTRLDGGDPESVAAIMAAVERVAAAAAFTLGDEVEQFERAFADYCAAGHAVGLSSGTAALELALRGLGVGPGDEVVVPTNSFFATAEAVSAVGATPVLVDVDSETALITAEIVERALTPRTRCVIPVHLYGRPVDLDPLVALCRERGVAVVEDACQAHGARYRGRPVGSIGDAGCFSFYPTKNLGAWGDGGALVTGDAALAQRVRLLRAHGEAERHVHELVAGTDRLHALQAAILNVKLPRLEACNDARRAAGRALRSALAGSGVTTPAAAPADLDHVFHLFVVQTPERDALRAHLGERGIASAVHYPTPIHRQPAYASLGMGPGSLPVAERLATHSCSLPIFPGISDGEIERIATAIADFGA
jgi:dTDP-4-amino-4,6-dideoxygalactose transaminase